jgi:hypothetical protein
VLDLVRATVVFEEPYALACFVKYVQKTMRTVRLKNRFEHDAAERISAARLQQEFYAAEAWGYEDAESVASSGSGRESYDKMYRDVMLNVEVPREGGPPFIAELQVALSGIVILKKSEQVVYTIMRMKRPADLVGTFVFDHEDLAVTIDVEEPEEALTRALEDVHREIDQIENHFIEAAVYPSAEKSVLPPADKGLRPTRLEEAITTESSIIRPTGLEETTRLQAERIEQLETTIATLSGQVEQLQAALNIRPSQTVSWFGCTPTCDTNQ